jgi:hypothetical protein
MAVPTIESLDDLVDAIAFSDRLDAELALAAERLRRRGDWAVDGAVSFRSWLRQHARLSQSRITAMLRTGRFLARFGSIADAVRTGRLPESHATALRDVARAHRRATLDDEQAALVEALAPERGEPVDDDRLREVCQAWAERVDAEHDGPEPKEPERSFTMSRLPDGAAFGSFNLASDAANELEQALQTARAWNGAGDDRTAKVRNADAFDDVVRFFNANHGRTGSKRHHPNVTIHVNADDLDDVAGPHATTSSGTFVPRSAAAAYLCDCVIHRVVHAGSIRTDYGRAVRTVPRQLFHVVAERDRGCRFPGCDRPQAWCDAHHVVHWTPPHRGETKLDNLLLLCNRHHHVVHQQRWKVDLDPSGEARFTTPDGRVFLTRSHAPPDVARAA